MKAGLRVCDFCWNDDSKIVLAKAFWKVITASPDDDNRVDACAKHTKDAIGAGIESPQKIEQPELPYW